MMNTYYYNGFDVLDRDDYDAVMESLMGEVTMQEEIADAAARDYFTRELGKDAAAHGEAAPTCRYQLVIAWSDFSSKTESTNEIAAALQAVTIYIEDASCEFVQIYDWILKRDIFDWSR